MNKLLTYSGLLLLVSTVFVMAVQTGSEWSVPGVLDNRSTFGGQAVHGNHVYVSPRQASVTPDVTFKINGKNATGWSKSKPFWDSTSVGNAIYRPDNNVNKPIAVLNDANVVFHGGVLEQNETWAGDKVHLVQYSTRVPSGVTLTIAEDAIVKFCDGVNLIIDSGATLVVGNAYFTHIADDTLGGDTNLDGNASSPKKDAFQLTVNGAVRPIGNPFIYYLTPSRTAKLYILTCSNCTSDRNIYFLGATVYLKTTPIPNWPVEENVVTWNSTPSTAITQDTTNRFAATLTMPASNVTVTATVTKQKFDITTISCTVDETPKTPETLATLTATIPPGQPPEEYEVEWSSEPAVTITPNADDHTKATFIMPHSPITVTCTVTRKTYQLTIVKGYVMQDGQQVKELMLPKDRNVTIFATLIDGVPAEDFIIDWSISPNEAGFSAKAQNKASVSYKMPNHAVTVTIDAKQMFHITTDTCTADMEKALPHTLVTLTATIPAGQPPEEYIVEWSSEPAVTITPNADDHTKATFEMPGENITVTCTVTRKTYLLTVVNGVAVKDGNESPEIELEKDEVVTVKSIQYDIENWSRMIGWTTEEDFMGLLQDATAYTTTFTMTNTPLTLTANYEEMPYLPEDTDHSKSLTLEEYLQAKDAMQSHSVAGDLCTTDENGNTVYLPNETVLSGTEGDYIRRSVQPAVYAEGSTIKVTFEISNPADFQSCAIFENIPENWHWYILRADGSQFGSSGPVIFDVANTMKGVVWTISDSTGATIYHQENNTGVPQAITFFIKPDKDVDLTDTIQLVSSEAVGNIGNSYLDVLPADSSLQKAIPHWADANKDLKLSSMEILAARNDLITIILHGGQYVWDGEAFIPYPLLEPTRGDTPEQQFEIARQLSTAEFDLGSRVSVTLDLSPLARTTLVSLVEKVPQGWTVIENGGGKVAKDGSFILFDFDMMDAKPGSITYTLQAPSLYAEQEYTLSSTLCKGTANSSITSVMIPNSTLCWSNPKPSLTVFTSGKLAQWRINNGEWLESGTRLAVATETSVSIQLKLLGDNFQFGEWQPIDHTIPLTTPKAESLAITMPNHDVAIKARLLSPREFTIATGWNFLCKTAEMATIEELNGPVFYFDQNQYQKSSFLALPLGTAFWYYSHRTTTITLYPEAAQTPSNYRPARLKNGWQGIGSPDARLNCIVKPDDADSIFAWQNGKWVLFDTQNGTIPLSAEQGYFLFK